MTNALSRIVGDSGKVFSFEFHEERAEQARQTFQKIGNQKNIVVTTRDVCQDGFLIENVLEKGSVDAVFLDLPNPWNAVSHAHAVLKEGGVVVSYSPCLEQVLKTCNELRSQSFESVSTVEVRQHPWDSFFLAKDHYEFQANDFNTDRHKPGTKKQHRGEDSILLLKPKQGEVPGFLSFFFDFFFSLIFLGHTAFLTYAKKILKK